MTAVSLQALQTNLSERGFRRSNRNFGAIPQFMGAVNIVAYEQGHGIRQVIVRIGVDGAGNPTNIHSQDMQGGKLQSPAEFMGLVQDRRPPIRVPALLAEKRT